MHDRKVIHLQVIFFSIRNLAQGLALKMFLNFWLHFDPKSFLKFSYGNENNPLKMSAKHKMFSCNLLKYY